MAHEYAKGRIGTTLRDKYRLDALLGVGGMAAVYRGAHRNGNRVAVKMLHPELSMIEDLRSRFLKEGYVANAVEHPGAVRVLDDDVTEDGQVFLVMELLEGDTLEALFKRSERRQMRPNEVAEYAAQVLVTLAAAHAQGIVHRDIKPENLFVMRDGQVKILDFGIARMRAPNAQAVTMTGRMIGTPAYMPPEQALGLAKQIDGRTDLWALGATMFTLMSGAHVHSAETMETMIVLTATRPAPPLSSVAPHCPVPLMRVVDRALSFAMDDRYPDASAMHAALAQAYAASFGSPLPDRTYRSSMRMEDMPPTERIVSEPGIASARAASSAPSAPSAPSHRPDRTLPVLLPVPTPAPGFPITGPIAASTTAGMSSEYGRAMLASDGRGPVTAAPAGSRRRVAIIVSVVALVFSALASFAVVTLTGAGRTRGAPPPKGTEPAASQEPIPKPSATAVSTPDAMPETSASSPPPIVPVPVVADAAPPVVKPVPGPGPRPVVVKPPRPAGEDCNPPFFYEPGTGKKRVKPGC